MHFEPPGLQKPEPELLRNAWYVWISLVFYGVLCILAAGGFGITRSGRIVLEIILQNPILVAFAVTANAAAGVVVYRCAKEYGFTLAGFVGLFLSCLVWIGAVYVYFFTTPIFGRIHADIPIGEAWMIIQVLVWPGVIFGSLAPSTVRALEMRWRGTRRMVADQNSPSHSTFSK